LVDTIGFIFLDLGAAGIFLPLFPLAAICFSRGSPKLFMDGSDTTRASGFTLKITTKLEHLNFYR